MFSEFDWDEKKADSNRRKHGVTFEQGITAFDDYFAIIQSDDDHDEPRFVLIGESNVGVVVVSFAERDGDITRIINVRKAMRKEKLTYEQNKAVQI